VRIPLIKPDLPDFDLVAGPLREVLESGRITNFGRYVQELEAEAGAYLGTQVATTSSGTAGLLLALQALGLQPGGKVILPSFTFMATAQAVLYAGGVPLFAEIEDDLTLSPSDLESILASHEDIGAVIPVHMYGLPCRVDEIQQVIDAACAARSRRIPVLYDAAHAFGSSLEGERVGGFGDAEVFSLSVTKVLVGVEGGMVSSRNPYLIERVRKMRNYGIETGYDAHLPGLNAKMSELHGIVGLHNLRRLDALLVERQWKARRYLDLIHAHTNLATPRWPEGVVHTFKDLTVLLPPGMAHRRAEIMASLRARGIETRAYFSPPVHQQRFFARFADRPLPRTEALARSVITLPFYTSMSEEEMEYVVDGLRRATRMAA
jgi:dTDP-4-amino-4,6-dideoxygalactose transaminase